MGAGYFFRRIWMTAPSFPLQEAHRWFAIELNNLAWDLLESTSRSEEENERMVHAAHASTFHWLQVGTTLNHLRAQCLLATVYSALGYGDCALRHAERCLALSEEVGDLQTPFDRASAHGCASVAYACVRAWTRSEEQRKAAAEAAIGLDAEEKAVFESLFVADNSPR
jgi:hypothetical protein